MAAVRHAYVFEDTPFFFALFCFLNFGNFFERIFFIRPSDPNRISFFSPPYFRFIADVRLLLKSAQRISALPFISTQQMSSPCTF